MGIFREYQNKCFWRTKCFGKGTSSVYGIADIKQEGTSSVYGIADIKREGTSSVYTVSEIKQENPFLVSFYTSNWNGTYSSPFLGAIATPVLDFWWCLRWVLKPGWILLLACFIACAQWIPPIQMQHLLTSWQPAWQSSHFDLCTGPATRNVICDSEKHTSIVLFLNLNNLGKAASHLLHS